MDNSVGAQNKELWYLKKTILTPNTVKGLNTACMASLAIESVVMLRLALRETSLINRTAKQVDH